MENKVIAMIAVGVVCLMIITGVILYDFAQRQQAIKSISYNDCLLATTNGQIPCERYK